MKCKFLKYEDLENEKNVLTTYYEIINVFLKFKPQK